MFETTSQKTRKKLNKEFRKNDWYNSNNDITHQLKKFDNFHNKKNIKENDMNIKNKLYSLGYKYENSFIINGEEGFCFTKFIYIDELNYKIPVYIYLLKNKIKKEINYSFIRNQQDIYIIQEIYDRTNRDIKELLQFDDSLEYVDDSYSDNVVIPSTKIINSSSHFEIFIIFGIIFIVVILALLFVMIFF